MTSSVRACVPVLLPVLLLAPVLGAQAMPAPATELAKLKPLEGSWEGAGTVVENGQTMKWTCDTTAQWVLGGHFLQQDTYINFEGTPMVLAFHDYFGWDRENKRYVTVAVSNEGNVTLSDLTFLPDGTMLSLRRFVHDGVPFAWRERTKIDGDTSSFTMDQLGGSGPSGENVKGTMKKVAKGRAHALEATASMAPASEPMARLLKMAGKYETKGGFVMEPGAKEVQVTATETITGIFGNTVLQSLTKGTAEGMPGEHEGRGFIAWDPYENCYTQVWVDNLGMVGAMSGRFAADGKSFLLTGTALEQGQPVAMRLVMDLDEKGMPKRNVGHSLRGTAAPFQFFTMNYARK